MALAIPALFALIGACSGQPPADPEAYLAAARSRGQPGACAAMRDPALRGECVALAAHEAATDGRVDEARAACDSQPGGTWRDECFFLVADAADVSGETARRACGNAGKWRHQCLGHAINRDAQDIFEELGPGREDEIEARVLAVVGAYLGPREAPERTHDILVSHLAAREPTARFSLATCGVAARDVCRDAYTERVRLVVRGDGATLRRGCGRTPSVERAAAAGLPTWEPEMDEVVSLAWKDLCAR